ncbi:MAG: hypothetical protein KGI94_02365 [Paracoccaceae bacterium]|nr:hypothetical protein [Paracoccaceae bacterium]
MARERKRHVERKEGSAKAAPALVTRADSAATISPAKGRATANRVVNRRGASDLDRLRAARETVAALVLRDPVYAPIFKRLDDEIAAEEAALSQDVVARARALLRHRATGASNS